MQILLDVPEHEPGVGFRFSWDTPPLLAVDRGDHNVVLSGDRSGLRALAQALVAMAGDDVPDGTELVLDGWIGMTGEVPHLVVRRTG